MSYTIGKGKEPETMEEIVNRLVKENLLTEDERDTILGNEEKQIKGTGKVAIGKRTIVFGCPNLKNYIQEGDIIKYDATKIDVAGTKTINTEKITYKSPKGNALNHGNGEKEQTFTAKSGLTWKVLSVSRDKVEIIPEAVIKNDTNEDFTMTGAIGYLYAEQELNEICKLYGYGYGADTSIGATYTIGGPLDTPIIRTISDTGARSINVDDINKLAGLITDEDFKGISASYGDNTNPIEEVLYPTMDSTKCNIETGISTQAGIKNITYRGYKYDKSKIPDSIKIKDTLFNGNYWLSSRAMNGNPPKVNSPYGNGTFIVRFVEDNYVRGPDLLTSGYNAGIIKANSQTRHYAIRPVVTIKGETIDIENITTDSESDANIWNLK